MGNSAKNIAIILGIITIGAGGYWLYTQEVAATPEFNGNEVTMQNMLSRTQVFIERRQQLDQVELDISFFEDDRFQSLRSFTTPIVTQPVGRSNPFESVDVSDELN
jgi:hypothetical protein